MPGAAVVAQTISIVDKSGKVVGTSKQLRNVFSEAKMAYLERKAEIKAERKKKEERELQKAIKAMSVADEEERSDITRHRSRHHHRRLSDSGSRHAEGQRYHRHRSGSHSPPSQVNGGAHINLADFNQNLHSSNQPFTTSNLQSRSVPVSPIDIDPANALIRRSMTENNVALASTRRPQMTRSLSATAADVDLDLAYGEFHEPDLNPSSPTPPRNVQLATQQQQQQELSGLVFKCQSLLDEANCAAYSVKKIITHLQENPDAMAAVALTLAEISNVASKMAPGALAALKGSAPAVFALLAAPEFLIAVGVGVGITVVCFGGYKIIKKIKEGKFSSSNSSSEDNLLKNTGAYPGVNPQRGISADGDELLDVRELDRIEMWRRGIADNQLSELQNDAGSVVSGYSGTSVEGEYITPFAQRSMGHLPLRSHTGSSRKKLKSKDEDKKKDRKKKSTRRDGEESETGSVTSKGSSGREREKSIVKVKKPSPLRRLLTAS